MKKMLLICVIAIISLSAGAQTTTFTLFEGKQIMGLNVGGGWDVTLRQGSSNKVTVTMTERVRDDFKFEVNNGVFSVRTLKSNIRGDYWKNLTLKLDIVCTSLEVANISGGVDLNIYGDFKANNLTMNISGGADVVSEGILTCKTASLNISGGADGKLALVTNSTYVVASGGATIRLSGKSETASFSASGAGDVFAKEFVVQDVTVTASGGADVAVHAVKTLSVSQSGGADVGYKGNPSINMRNNKLRKFD